MGFSWSSSSRREKLVGMGWEHDRCMGPMLAAARAWASLRPGVEIEWSTRPLAAFNDQPLEELARSFDLLVIDHPFAGTAARTACLVPLDDLLPESDLAERAGDSVGRSHASYAYEGRQWALAVDAACQVAVARDDLLASHVQRAPETWEEVLALAAALPSRVAIPLYPTDAICSLLSLCTNLVTEAARGDSCFPDRDVGTRALALLSDLVPFLHPESFSFNPPRALDRMRDSDEIAYMPLVFGYTNYSRPESGARARLRFLDIPSAGAGPVGSLLGGGGLAVSSRSRHSAEAAAFVAWATGREAQAEVIFPAGGQPASRSAWLDPALDAASGGFFSGTRATIEAAHVRPRAPWWPPFQEEAGHAVVRALQGRERAEDAVVELERLYRRAKSEV